MGEAERFFKKKDPLGQVGNAEGVVSEKIHRGEGTKNELRPARFVRDDVTYEGNGDTRHQAPEILKPVSDEEREVIGGIDISAYDNTRERLEEQRDQLIADGKIAEAGFFQAQIDRLPPEQTVDSNGNLMEELNFGEGKKGAPDEKLAA